MTISKITTESIATGVSLSGNTVLDNLVVTGDLTVSGNTTTLNVETLTIEDKNIVLANVASPSNVTADGAGITVLGATNKTLNWVSANNSWESSENLNLVYGKEYRIANTTVLTGSSLGSGITGSSLTSVGTLSSLNVSGNVGIGTSSPSFALEVHKQITIKGNNPSSNVEYLDWPHCSFNIRRSDDYSQNGITMASFGYRSDPTYFTDNSVCNIRIRDQGQSASCSTSNTTTKMTLGSPGTFSIITGNSGERFFINSSGYAGIGTTDPLNRLHLSGDADTRIRIDGTTTQGVYFTKNGADNGTFRSDTDGNFQWYTKTAGLSLSLTAGGILSFPNTAGNKIDFYNTGTDRYGIQVQSSELRIHSGAAGDASGGITFGKDSGTVFTEAMRVYNGGYVTAVNSFRSPIFYDSADTTSYVDPAGESRLQSLIMKQILYIRHLEGKGWDNFGTTGDLYLNYNNHTYNIDFCNNKGGVNSAGSYVWGSGSVRAPIFYDSNDTGYYVDPNDTTKLLRLKLIGYSSSMQNGTLDIGSTSLDYKYTSGWATSMQAGILANCANNWEFVIHDAGDALASPFCYNGGTSNRNFEIGRDLGWGNMYTTIHQSARSPLFYDSNDTGYYVDPNGTSNIWQLTLASLRTNFNRTWENYPCIQVLNTTDQGPQSEFRIHGSGGANGGDFSVVTRCDGGYATGSDSRRKVNVEPIENALDKIMNLNGRKFNIVNKELEIEDTLSSNGKKFGFIAQEAIDVIPEAIKYYPESDIPNENGWASAYSIDYPSVVALLTEAIKELSLKNIQLEERLSVIESK